jgi:Tol biopolymer transport system component
MSVGYTRQVFVVKSDGGAHRLTRGPTEHETPSWSPSGTRIALSASYNRIEVRDVAGAVRHEIRGGGQSTGQASWSPDGRRIAFVSYHEATDRPFQGNLVVTSPDGSDRHIVATHADGRPAWSRDGKTLYYLHAHDVGARHELWSIPSSGGSARRLAAGVRYDSRVLLSPRGDWILFLRSARVGRNGLWIVRTDGVGRRFVGPYRARSYGWVPGGRAIFGGKNHNRPIVTSITGERRFLSVRFKSSLYDWSPDGKRIAWVDGQISSKPVKVLSARPDGTARRLLARFTSKSRLTEATDLGWSPDSRRLTIVPYRHVGD